MTLSTDEQAKLYRYYTEPKMVTELTRKSVALVLAGGEGSRLMDLTAWRAKPAVPIGGKYRIIDFALSNCVNSGIRRIGVLTQYKSHSLIRHLQRAWGFMRAEIGEFVEILPAQQRTHKKEWYQGTADALYQNIDIVQRHHPEYVIVLGGDHVYTMDYSEMLLLSLNVVGAGVSYLPRDLGSEARGVVGAEHTKILNTCCCILKDNDAKKLAYMANKVEERKRHQEDLIRAQNEEDGSTSHTRENCQGSESSSDIQPPDGNNRHTDSSKEDKGASGRSGEIPYRLTAEEEKEGELVKAALQVIGNLAYGCSSVQVLHDVDLCISAY